MAGVRKIRDLPLRYLVTWSHHKRLDDCVLSIVEETATPPGEAIRFRCRTHAMVDCACVREVTDARSRVWADEGEE